MKFLNTLLLIFLLGSIPLHVSAQEVTIGEAYVVGGVGGYYFQYNGTVGKMIVRDGEGTTHFSWRYYGAQINQARDFMYNSCNDDDGDFAEQFDNPYIVVNRSSSGSIDVDPSNENQPIVCSVAPYENEFESILGIVYRIIPDGIGRYPFPDIQLSHPETEVSYPQLTVGVNGNFYVSALGHWEGELDQFTIYLWNTNRDEEENGNPIEVDQTAVISHRIQASHESERVAIAWHRNLIGDPPEEWEGYLAWQMNNDLYISESEDGEEWDFDNPTNITRTMPVDLELDGTRAYGDTLRPYTDVDIIYVDDVVHAVFTTCGLWMDISGEGDDPWERLDRNKSLIWHWDSESDSLTLVANGWYENEFHTGNWNSNVDRPSIGVGEDGTLYCVFQTFSDADIGDYGQCHGELILSKSDDDGITWSEPLLLTGTIGEIGNGDELEMVNEVYPSLAEKVDEFLHISYVQSSELIYDWQEGYETLASSARMIYQRIAVDDLPDLDDLPMPREGFQYHNREPLAIGDNVEPNTPYAFSLNQNYPNPFNSTTEISYSLPIASTVTLTIFNTAGKVVAELVNERQLAGNYQTTWNSLDQQNSSVASGLYIYQLITRDEVGSMNKIERRMVLLK